MFLADSNEESCEKIVNVQALQSLVESSDARLDDEVAPPRRIGPAIGWGASTTAVLLALAAAFWMVNRYETAAEERTDMVAAAPIEQPVDLKPLTAFQADDVKASIRGGVATVEAAGTPLVTIHAAKGSRYESLAARAKSVELRLRHVAGDASKADEQPGRFLARRNGESYEVVWTRNDESAFRILDVTSSDVRAWKKENGETSRSILANVIADKLNAALYSKALPTS